LVLSFLAKQKRKYERKSTAYELLQQQRLASFGVRSISPKVAFFLLVLFFLGEAKKKSTSLRAEITSRWVVPGGSLN